jgi:hypothetical protein
MHLVDDQIVAMARRLGPLWWWRVQPVQTQLIGQKSQVFLLTFFYIPARGELSPTKMPPLSAA